MSQYTNDLARIVPANWNISEEMTSDPVPVPTGNIIAVNNVTREYFLGTADAFKVRLVSVNEGGVATFNKIGTEPWFIQWPNGTKLYESASHVVQVSTSRALADTDNGKTLECTGVVTLSIPVGLSAGFTCNVIPYGVTTVDPDTGVNINGLVDTITRVDQIDAMFTITARSYYANSYVVTGANYRNLVSTSKTTSYAVTHSTPRGHRTGKAATTTYEITGVDATSAKH